MNDKILPVFLSITALVVSISSVVIMLVRVPEMEIDIFSGLIGVLGVMVTVLIGFQIWQAISFERRLIRHKREIIKEVKGDLEPLIKGWGNFNLGTLSMNTAYWYMAIKKYSSAINSASWAIEMFTDCEDLQHIEYCVYVINESIKGIRDHGMEFNSTEEELYKNVGRVSSLKTEEAYKTAADMMALFKECGTNISDDIQPDTKNPT